MRRGGERERMTTDMRTSKAKEQKNGREIGEGVFTCEDRGSGKLIGWRASPLKRISGELTDKQSCRVRSMGLLRRPGPHTIYQHKPLSVCPCQSCCSRGN